jgi:hypothetical protein
VTENVVATEEYRATKKAIITVPSTLGGLVGAHAMLKDDSLIGPVLFHAGYDLMIMVSILESL